MRENPEDPVLLQFIQMAMMREQQMRARSGGGNLGEVGPSVTAASSSASGLWTPDQPAAESAPSGGGSKLWIPGQ